MSTGSTKTMKGRISNKHGTEEYWILSVYKSLEDQSEANKRDNPFIPLAGELIIYDPDSIYKYPRFKYGNNVDNVIDLPFVVEDTIEKARLDLDTEEKTVVGAINEMYKGIGALEASAVNQATADEGLIAKIEDNNLHIAIDDETVFIFDGGSTGLDVEVNEFGGVTLNLGNFNETLKIEENEFGGQTAVIE